MPSWRRRGLLWSIARRFLYESAADVAHERKPECHRLVSIDQFACGPASYVFIYHRLPMATPFWDSPENVERFAAREPDVRLGELLREYSSPAKARVLDLGCAAGRNAVLLAQRGFDVEAVDASAAMVAKTRERMTPILGAAESERRVRVGRMDDLSWAVNESFDLVAALGLYHCAESRPEWDRALSETARVLAPGGKLLVSVFTPETDLTGRGTRPVAGEPHVYEGFDSGGRHFLVDAAELDEEMARHGLLPVEPTRTARPKVEVGRRVSANGLYVKSRSAI
jgi:SAM-dependent methyltransferase